MNPMSEDTAKAVYAALRKYGPMTAQDVAETVGISNSGAQAALQVNLAHILKRERLGRAFYYSPKNKAKPFTPAPVQPVEQQVEQVLEDLEDVTPTVQASDVQSALNIVTAEIQRLEDENAELKDELNGERRENVELRRRLDEIAERVSF